MTAPEVPVVEPEKRLGRRSFWASAVVGWAIVAYGVRGLLHHHVDTRPGNLARFFVGGALVHDLLFAPVVLLAGVGLARAAPRRVRAWLQAGLFVSGCLVLFSYPLVRNYARVIHNPSSLPHNYAANLTITLGVVWGALIAAATIAAVLNRGRPTMSPSAGARPEEARAGEASSRGRRCPGRGRPRRFR